MSKLVKAYDKASKESAVDNRVFQHLHENKAIELAYVSKWLRAFTTTRDPLHWLQKRKNTSKRIIKLRSSLHTGVSS